MRLALAQARRARGKTFPNPPVGAVVYRGDRVLGRGFTRPAGGDHAEIVALDSALRRAGARAVRGASLATTLEPCSHLGRTGPCAERVIAAGLARVEIGHVDPHLEVSGRGVRRLRRSGVHVRVGVLAEACREQHRGFLSVCEHGRPFVALKLASSLDGRIATARGESRWITGPASRALVHRLRERVDAVAVGAGTVRADNPELFARRDRRVVHRPLRVVFASQLRVPASSRLFRGSGPGTWVLCAPDAPGARRRRLEATGARVIEVPLARDGLDLRRALRALARAGLTEILVEGGGELAASLLRLDLVDEVHWFTAPRLLGGDARPALGPLAGRSLAAMPQLRQVDVKRLGDDVYVRGVTDRTRSRRRR